MKQYITDFNMNFLDKTYPCEVPCSVYKTLVGAGELENPYWRENERVSTPVCDNDVSFTASFTLSKDMLSRDKLELIFEGIDTLSDVCLNGVHIASTDNMHRTRILNRYKHSYSVLRSWRRLMRGLSRGIMWII